MSQGAGAPLVGMRQWSRPRRVARRPLRISGVTSQREPCSALRRALRGCDRAGANKNAVGPGAASRSRVASIGQARWNLLRPPRARKWARTPCSRPTQGGAHAAIGPKCPGPSKETNIYRVVSGAAPASLRAGAAWSRGPACGDATVEPALSVSPPASCVSPRSDPQRGPSSALRHASPRYLPWLRRDPSHPSAPDATRVARLDQSFLKLILRPGG